MTTMSVRVFVCLPPYLSNHTSDLRQISFMCVIYVRDSVFFWWCVNALRTFAFMDDIDIIFALNGS